MAKSGTFTVSNNSSGTYSRISWSTTTNSANNQSTVTVRLQGYTTVGTYGSGTWVLKIGSSTYSRSATFSAPGSWTTIVSASRTVTHDADGSLDINIGVNSGGIPGTSWTTTSGTQTVALDDFVRTPGTPGSLTVSNITPTTADLAWAAPSSPLTITAYQWRVRLGGTSSGTLVDYGDTSGGRTAKAEDLTPGTLYGFIVRAQNADGWGDWASYKTFTTLPSGAPTLTVTASPTGSSSTVSLTAPGGISGVDSYEIQYRVKGSSSTTTVTTTTSTKAITGLTPGKTYEYRSRAIIGSYTSPWSSWVSKQQPAPSTEPGAYFDGATESTPDQTYQWSGTAHASTSQAVGTSPTGWRDFARAATASGGTGVVARVTDPWGEVGDYAARFTFLTDATAAGFRVGPIGDNNYADVTEFTEYTGSLYIKPSRSQRFRPEIRWYNASQTLLSTSPGEELIIGAGAYKRVTVTATSPAGAEFAVVDAIDVEGDGWSLWLSGQTVTADAAMLTVGGTLYAYFDGAYPASGGYSYAWSGTANASTSTRTEAAAAAVNPLADPDCDDLPTPPRAPVIDENCVDEIALWRRDYIEIPASYTYDWQDVVPTIRLRSATDYPGIPGDVRQVRIRVHPNPFEYKSSEVDVSSWCAEMIVSYIPSDTVLTIDGEIQRVFAEVKGAAAIPADHLVYGTGGAPATWPVLECGIAYLVTVDTPLAGLTPVDDLLAEILLTRRF